MKRRMRGRAWSPRGSRRTTCGASRGSFARTSTKVKYSPTPSGGGPGGGARTAPRVSRRTTARFAIACGSGRASERTRGARRRRTTRGRKPFDTWRQARTLNPMQKTRKSPKSPTPRRSVRRRGWRRRRSRTRTPGRRSCPSARSCEPRSRVYLGSAWRARST